MVLFEPASMIPATFYALVATALLLGWQGFLPWFRRLRGGSSRGYR
jgi:hypothetical protein